MHRHACRVRRARRVPRDASCGSVVRGSGPSRADASAVAAPVSRHVTCGPDGTCRVACARRHLPRAGAQRSGPGSGPRSSCPALFHVKRRGTAVAQSTPQAPRGPSGPPCASTLPFRHGDCPRRHRSVSRGTERPDHLGRGGSPATLRGFTWNPTSRQPPPLPSIARSRAVERSRSACQPRKPGVPRHRDALALFHVKLPSTGARP